jgi:hypothetical protein
LQQQDAPHNRLCVARCHTQDEYARQRGAAQSAPNAGRAPDDVIGQQAHLPSESE